MAAEAIDDPTFGPWFGSGYLESNLIKLNQIPSGAGGSGVQDWKYVGDWHVKGPFPAGEWSAEIPALMQEFSSKKEDIEFDLLDTKKSEVSGLPDLDQIQAVPVETKKEKSDLIKMWRTDAFGRQWPPPWGFKPQKRKSEPDTNDAGQNQSYFYARTTIYAEKAIELWAALSADDRAKLWHNGELVAISPAVHPGQRTVTTSPQRTIHGIQTKEVTAYPLSEDTQFFKLRLKAGPNDMIVCCQNEDRTHYFRLALCVRGAPQTAAQVANRTAAISKLLAQPAPKSIGFLHDGHNSYPDATPVIAWDWDAGTNIRWRVPLCAPAKAAPLVIGDAVFTLIDPGVLVCLDAATGAIRWESTYHRIEQSEPNQTKDLEPFFEAYRQARTQAIAANGTPDALKVAKDAANIWREAALKADAALRWGWDQWTGHSMATPVTDGKHIWVKSATGVVACFDLSGRRIWMTMIERPGHWNTPPSPILVGDPARLILRLPVGQVDKNGKMAGTTTHHRVMALDAASGEVVWSSDLLPDNCWSHTPATMRLSDGRQTMDVIVSRVSVLRADDGRVLIPALAADLDAGTPIVDGDRLYLMSGNSSAWQLVMLDRDTVGAKALWRNSTNSHAFDANPTLHRGLLYGMPGGQGCKTIEVFDPANGLPVALPNPLLPPMRARAYVPTTGAGNYVFFMDNGIPFAGKQEYAEVMVISLYPEGRPVAHNHLEKGLIAPPVFSADRMYVRSDTWLSCIALTGPEGEAYLRQIEHPKHPTP